MIPLSMRSPLHPHLGVCRPCETGRIGAGGEGVSVRMTRFHTTEIFTSTHVVYSCADADSNQRHGTTYTGFNLAKKMRIQPNMNHFIGIDEI